MSCGALPPWPTLSELEASGSIVLDADVAVILIGILVGLGGGLAFALQVAKIASKRSVQGASMVTVVLSMLATCGQVAAMAVARSPALEYCQDLQPWVCFQNLLPLVQIGMQAVGTLAVFAIYMYYWHIETVCDRRGQLMPNCQMSPLAGAGVAVLGNEGRSSRRLRAAVFAWFSLAVVLLVMGFVPAIPFSAGPCSDAAMQALVTIDGAAALVQTLVFLPQILLLFSVRAPGALSVASIAVQGFGGMIFIVDMVIEKSSIWAVLPFIVVVAECLCILALIAYFARPSDQGATNP